MRPILDDVQWPGRRVRPVSPSTAAGPTQLPGADEEGDESPISILPAEERPLVSVSMQETDAVVSQLETEAYTALENALNIPTDRLPQTREAVRMLSGTHPLFGEVLPSVPEDEILEGDSITAPVFERAYDTMEHADRSLYGFDVADIVSEDYDGTIRPYGPVLTPMQASGSKPIPKLDDKVTLEEGLEERLTTKKRDIWYMMFVAVLSFVLNFLGDKIKALGDTVSDTLSFRLPVIGRVRVGKFVAKPFWWLADVFYKAAARAEKRANGLHVEEPAVNPYGGDPNPEPQTIADRADTTYTYVDENGVTHIIEDELDDFEIQDGVDAGMPPLNSNSFAGSSGLQFVMAAHQVLQTTQSVAMRPNENVLRDALLLYESSRQARQQFETFRTIAVSWGAEDLPRTTPQTETDPDSPAPSTTFAIDCD